jgi:hypothetical protein
MRINRLKTLYLITMAAILPGMIIAESGAQCRELSEQVWYEAAPDRGPQVSIVKGTLNGATRMVVIERHGRFYGTTNLGAHWAPLDGVPRTTLVYTPEAVISPSQPRVMYAYENIGILKRSIDGGMTWTIPRPHVQGLSGTQKAFAVSHDPSYVLKVELAAIHPVKPLTIYATIRVAPPEGSKANFSPRYFLKGMYISEDGGDNWVHFSDEVGIFDKYPRHVVLGINPTDDKIMFSEGQLGILHSRDGGNSWIPVGQSELLNQEPLDTQDRSEGIFTPVRKGVLGVRQFVFDPSSPKIVYMVTWKGIYRSLDGGDTWVLLNLGFDRLNAVNSFAVDPVQTSRVFVGTDRGLFVSEDRGCSFSKIPIPER